MTWRASLSFSSPFVTSSATRATWTGVIASSSSALPDSLALRASSPIHHLRAEAASAPASIVATIGSRAPALRMDCMSLPEMPHSSRSRLRRTSGSSGSADRISSTHSREGATGTRSGSGKYR
ncbi:hypothetical protein STENM36S_03275 [Streptomyces tendae]